MHAISVCCFDFVNMALLFTVRLDNLIGSAGVQHLANMLKVNTTLTRLVVDSSALCLICIFRVFRLLYFADILNDCICCDVDYHIDEDGFRDIAEALKVNSTLIDLDLQGVYRISCFFSFTSHLFMSRDCN